MSDGDDIMQLDRFRKMDVIAMGRATVDLYANETGPMEEAKTFPNMWEGLRPIPLLPWRILD